MVRSVAEPHLLARERKMKQRAPTRASIKPRHKTQVAASLRIQQFANENLIVDGEDIMCQACHGKNIANVADTIRKHVKADSHILNKEKYLKATMRQQFLISRFQTLQAEENRKVQPSIKTRRYEVVRTFMACGIPLSKVELAPMRSMLEFNNALLGSRSTLQDFINTVRDDERKETRQELGFSTSTEPSLPDGIPYNTIPSLVVAAGAHSAITTITSPIKVDDTKFVAIYFDGTSRVCECLSIIVRFAYNGYFQQRLLSMKLLKNACTAIDLLRVITSVLTFYNVPDDRVIAIGHDRASVNLAAYKLLSPRFISCLDVGCWSHTLDNAGKMNYCGAHMLKLTPSLCRRCRGVPCVETISLCLEIIYFAKHDTRGFLQTPHWQSPRQGISNPLVV